MAERVSEDPPSKSSSSKGGLAVCFPFCNCSCQFAVICVLLYIAVALLTISYFVPWTEFSVQYTNESIHRSLLSQWSTFDYLTGSLYRKDIATSYEKACLAIISFALLLLVTALVCTCILCCNCFPICSPTTGVLILVLISLALILVAVVVYGTVQIEEPQPFPYTLPRVSWGLFLVLGTIFLLALVLIVGFCAVCKNGDIVPVPAPDKPVIIKRIRPRSWQMIESIFRRSSVAGDDSRGIATISSSKMFDKNGEEIVETGKGSKWGSESWTTSHGNHKTLSKQASHQSEAASMQFKAYDSESAPASNASAIPESLINQGSFQQRSRRESKLTNQSRGSKKNSDRSELEPESEPEMPDNHVSENDVNEEIWRRHQSKRMSFPIPKTRRESTWTQKTSRSRASSKVGPQITEITEDEGNFSHGSVGKHHSITSDKSIEMRAKHRASRPLTPIEPSPISSRPTSRKTFVGDVPMDVKSLTSVPEERGNVAKMDQLSEEKSGNQQFSHDHSVANVSNAASHQANYLHVSREEAILAERMSAGTIARTEDLLSDASGYALSTGGGKLIEGQKGPIRARYHLMGPVTGGNGIKKTRVCVSMEVL